MGLNEWLKLTESLIQPRDDWKLRHVHIEPLGFEDLWKVKKHNLRLQRDTIHQISYLGHEAAVCHAEAVSNTAWTRCRGEHLEYKIQAVAKVKIKFATSSRALKPFVIHPLDHASRSVWSSNLLPAFWKCGNGDWIPLLMNKLFYSPVEAVFQRPLSLWPSWLWLCPPPSLAGAWSQVSCHVHTPWWPLTGSGSGLNRKWDYNPLIIRVTHSHWPPGLGPAPEDWPSCTPRCAAHPRFW